MQDFTTTNEHGITLSTSKIYVYSLPVSVISNEVGGIM